MDYTVISIINISSDLNRMNHLVGSTEREKKKSCQCVSVRAEKERDRNRANRKGAVTYMQLSNV